MVQNQPVMLSDTKPEFFEKLSEPQVLDIPKLFGPTSGRETSWLIAGELATLHGRPPRKYVA